MTKGEFIKIYNRAAKFRSLVNARNHRNASEKAVAIIQGDNLFWVVNLADGEKLIKLGYEAIH